MVSSASAAIALLLTCATWAAPIETAAPSSSKGWSQYSPMAIRWAKEPVGHGDSERERNEVQPVAAEVDSEPTDGNPDEADGLGGCDEADRECRDALGKLRADTLGAINLDIRVGGRPGNDYPCECRLQGETFKPRSFTPTTFTWKAAGYCHKPLYFEQWNLERYGHSYGFIPDVFLSGAHFFVTLPILPYKMGVELPWECVYPLGYYRPGNCAPWTCPAVPISGRGLALEAATITGAVFLLP